MSIYSFSFMSLCYADSLLHLSSLLCITSPPQIQLLHSCWMDTRVDCDWRNSFGMNTITTIVIETMLLKVRGQKALNRQTMPWRTSSTLYQHIVHLTMRTSMNSLVICILKLKMWQMKMSLHGGMITNVSFLVCHAWFSIISQFQVSYTVTISLILVWLLWYTSHILQVHLLMWSVSLAKDASLYPTFTTASHLNRRGHFFAMVTGAGMVFWRMQISSQLLFYLMSVVRNRHLRLVGITLSHLSEMERSPSFVIGPVLLLLLLLGVAFCHCHSQHLIVIIVACCCHIVLDTLLGYVPCPPNSFMLFHADLVWQNHWVHIRTARAVYPCSTHVALDRWAACFTVTPH